jgi:hypothetical protein
MLRDSVAIGMAAIVENLIMMINKLCHTITHFQLTAMRACRGMGAARRCFYRGDYLILNYASLGILVFWEVTLVMRLSQSAELFSYGKFQFDIQMAIRF